MRDSQFVLTICAIASVAVSAFGQSGNCTQTDKSTRPDCAGAVTFFRGFQLALRKNDRQTVASLVAYLVLTSVGGKQVQIKNRAQLLAHFDDIFNHKLRCAILSAREKDVWGNSRGFTINGGAIWFEGIIPPAEHPDIKAPNYWTKYPFKIITINNEGHFSCDAS